MAGDVTFVNDGDISVDGGHRTVTAISSNDLGTRALQFRNAFTEHFGAIFQGAGDLNFTRNGNVWVTGGGATTYSQVVNHTAEAKSDPGRSGGIYIPTYTSLNGVAHDFPIFDGLKIDMTGNVTVSGDAASSTALSQTTTAGSNNNIAEADNSGYTSAYGIYVDNGVDLDISLDGDVSVAGANSGVAPKPILAPERRTVRSMPWRALERHRAVGLRQFKGIGTDDPHPRLYRHDDDHRRRRQRGGARHQHGHYQHAG